MCTDRRTGLGTLYYDRRSNLDRRQREVKSTCERRTGGHRRSGQKRRSWVERRLEKMPVTFERRVNSFEYS